MVDIKFIRENPDLIKKAAKDKRFDVDIDRLLNLDKDIREITFKLENLRAKRNSLSSEIQNLQGEEKSKKIDLVKDLKIEMSELEQKMAPLQEEYTDLLLRVPSVPLPEVPIGKDENDNVEVKKWGEIPTFDFEPKDHIELAEKLDLIDTVKASKIAGSRSYFLKNDLVLLEMALCRFVLDKLISKGMTPMTVPVMVRESAMRGTGYFPTGYEQAYNITEDELFLVGTSEVSLVSYNADETFNKDELPKLFAGYSQCFRREAGTYGKDTRGLYRVHQFTKVEQVIICKADYEEAEKWHKFLLNNAEEILQDLNIPYRVVLECTGEIGVGQIKKHDIESWMPSRGAYCETHSCSTMGDYQARRSNIKYRDEDGTIKYAFTLNNTAIASPRVLIPILELNQNEDGTINVPKVLVPYMGKEIIGK